MKIHEIYKERAIDLSETVQDLLSHLPFELEEQQCSYDRFEGLNRLVFVVAFRKAVLLI